MRVLIAAQVRLYRDGLTEALGRDGRHEVVGAAATPVETLDVARSLTPDIVLVDISMPEAGRLVRHLANGGAKVLALGVEEIEEQVLPFVEDGICGYVSRNGSLADLYASLEATGRGESLCSPQVVAGIMARLAALKRERHGSEASPVLTSRERQVASLIDQGLSNVDIARQLDIEVPTVKNHVHNILEKLQVHRRGEAVARLRADPLEPMLRT